ncbi:hypothetical protein ASPWEDRAFT_61976 [Aspergillus wentii DTO 134E9]|uniref:F-box domain-containing protein n=1 Tax=Aspergillus wentii DTO 134E9 TaxID=1073089 RepID=A0A1L9RBH9_ASPWE|nr:uncharacterized protein ASPWEDRAFT_61976 [Aspergillus wentii DTO 134E9]OJJ32238.1 hypothetical protein ASPWEDRAFT_61976 [Aspergillus wentii DTO 134E9]
MDAKGAQEDGYQFDRAHGNEIIHMASYHRRDFDLAVINVDTHDDEQIRDSILEPVRAPSATLGSLECLPLEVVHKICHLLDLNSLFKLRQVNIRAHQIISTMRGYRATGLFKLLCIRDCHLCGSFGGFLFLPLHMRCCFSCVENDTQLRVIALADAKKWFKPTKTVLYSIPMLKSIPGIYSMDERSRKKRMWILAAKHITKTLASHGGEAPILRYMATTALPYLNMASNSVQYGVCCSGCQIALEEALRYSRVDENACALRDKVYSHDGFLGHFRQCPKAQDLWRMSQEGKDTTRISEFVRRRGDFKKRDVVMYFDR